MNTFLKILVLTLIISVVPMYLMFNDAKDDINVALNVSDTISQVSASEGFPLPSLSAEPTASESAILQQGTASANSRYTQPLSLSTWVKQIFTGKSRTYQVASVETLPPPFPSPSTEPSVHPSATPASELATLTQTPLPSLTPSPVQQQPQQPKLVTAHPLMANATVTVSENTVIVGDIQINGQKQYDNDPQTGAVVLFTKPATVIAPYGAHVITLDNKQSAEKIRKQEIEMTKALGCVGGCSVVAEIVW